MYIPTDDRSTDEIMIEYLAETIAVNQKSILNSKRLVANAKEALATYKKSGEQS